MWILILLLLAVNVWLARQFPVSAVGETLTIAAPVVFSSGYTISSAQFIDNANSAYFLDPAATGNSLITAGAASVSGNLVLNAAATIQTTNMEPLTIGSSTTGATTITSGGKLQLQAGGTGTGSTGTGSIYFLNSSGTTKGRYDTASVNGTGGTITSSGGYTIHTFTSSGTFTPPSALNVEYLVVAGGGGGAARHGGGGGGGGFRTATGFAVTAQGYTVTIGAGGTAGVSTGTSADTKGGAGGNSVFATITSIGGGGGNGYPNEGPPATGGSGGGGARSVTNKTGGSGTAGQGNAGGAGDVSAGGGGGAGVVGGAGTTVAGAGGAGSASSISGSSVTYAGGGGGGDDNAGGFGGSGGSGGGGAGASSSAGNGTAGTVNTGGGGGGARTDPYPSGDGAAGGSGIVIVRYLTVNYGTLYLGATNTSSADLAEYYVSGDPSISAGDVVTISNEKVVIPAQAGIQTGSPIGVGDDTTVDNKGVLMKAEKAYDSKLIGIISTSPGVLMGSIDGDSGKEDKRMLALSGRVPVKIDPDSPPIEVGDFLTSSSKPGLAMKATKAGYTVGKALESWKPGGPDRIEAFLQLTYYLGDIDERGNFTNLTVETLTADTVMAKTVKADTLESMRLSVQSLFVKGLNVWERLTKYQKDIDDLKERVRKLEQAH